MLDKTPPPVIEAPVRVVAPPPVVATGEPMTPTTTLEEDRLALSQRAMNMVWETTQMKIALSVIWASLLAALILSIGGAILGTPDIQLAAVVFLFGVANLVTGFYFGRTNHQRGGGVQVGR